jgi:hypothetical protein
MARGLYPDIEESDGKPEKAKRTVKYELTVAPTKESDTCRATSLVDVVESALVKRVVEA